MQNRKNCHRVLSRLLQARRAPKDGCIIKPMKGLNPPLNKLLAKIVSNRKRKQPSENNSTDRNSHATRNKIVRYLP